MITGMPLRVTSIKSSRLGVFTVPGRTSQQCPDGDPCLLFAITNLTNGQSNSFKLRAVNAHGAGEESSEFTKDFATRATLSEAKVSGDWVELTYSLDLDSSSVPPVGAFALAVDDPNFTYTVSEVYVEGPKAMLKLDQMVHADMSVSLSYTAPTGAGPSPCGSTQRHFQ